MIANACTKNTQLSLLLIYQWLINCSGTGINNNAERKYKPYKAISKS